MGERSVSILQSGEGFCLGECCLECLYCHLNNSRCVRHLPFPSRDLHNHYQFEFIPFLLVCQPPFSFKKIREVCTYRKYNMFIHIEK